MDRALDPRYPIAVVRERLRRQTAPVLDFAVGRHREAPPPALREILGDHGDSLLLQAGPDEIEAFATGAAAMLRRVYGVDLTPASVLPAPGGRTAMSLLASSVIRSGDGVLVTDPAYPAFARAGDQFQACLHVLPLDPDKGFSPDLGALSANEARAIRFAALNYPNNPTGAVISADVLADLLGSLDPGTVVFNDATYGPLTYEGGPWSLLAAAGNRHRIVELHSLAKIFALGPLSVAFLAGDEAIVADLREYSEFSWSHLSSFQVRVALACFEDGEQIGLAREVYGERLARLQAALEGLGFEPFPPASGMYVLCPAPSAIAGRPVAGAAEAAEVLLSEHGVAVVPWEVPPHGYLRFSGLYLPEELESLAGLAGGGKIATA